MKSSISKLLVVSLASVVAPRIARENRRLCVDAVTGSHYEPPCEDNVYSPPRTDTPTCRALRTLKYQWLISPQNDPPLTLRHYNRRLAILGTKCITFDRAFAISDFLSIANSFCITLGHTLGHTINFTFRLSIYSAVFDTIRI